MKISAYYFQITFNCILQSQELLCGSLQAAGKMFKYLNVCEHATASD